MTTATADEGDGRVAARPAYARLLSFPAIGALIGAIAVFVLFMAVAPPFRAIDNSGTILYQASTIGMMAVPVALLMIGGEFDLSAGVAVTTAALAASMIAWQWSLNVWVGVLLSLVLALGIGWFNGWLLQRTKLPSFLVTLGTFFILQGCNLAVTKLVAGGVTSPRITDIDGYDSAAAVFASDISIGGLHLEITLLFWLVLTVVAAVALTRLRIGNWILASGGDEASARAVGVPAARTKTGLFMFVGFCAWLLGMHTLFNFDAVQTNMGIGNEFIYIIAAVVGGCLLTGGYGSVAGASLGALIYGMTNLGITYAGWNPDWLKTFLGVMLVGATLINTFVRRQAAKR
ncbi:ABC transporter permease [Calidifontibacter sp. DB0510]|uniref:Xylose transport system permease protein XylH n=1 Tax=Metallococcus carri TaxID=1656884 RepID=A0A967AZY5_9MICO|nr:ABC transporter permease [Metallococcus carri]NHN56219.1 ABC transporter permease [Metallococcus carri]NOP38730.1 ABC transporter permease [Calidifontibacter sp. DB2511S]